MSSKKVVSKTWGNASLVLGIIGLLCIFAPYFGLPIAILAVIFANKQNKIEPTGQATAGNVLGIIGIILNAIMLLLVLLFVAAFGWASFL
jgi:cadmium resistance protein CadD (predicted permease)